MTNEDHERVLGVYTAFRGAALAEAESLEFAREFYDADPALVELAIRDLARETGRVFLAAVVAKHARLQTAARQQWAAADEAAKRTSGPKSAPNHSGWPTKPGEPTTTYLAGISFFGAPMYGVPGHLCEARGRRFAKRWSDTGLVLPQHAERVIAAMWGPRMGTATAVERGKAGGTEVEKIEQEIGSPWNRAPAEKYVQAIREIAPDAPDEEVPQ